MTRVWNTVGASTPTSSIPWDSSWPAFVPEPQRQVVLSYFERRFGIPLPAFQDYLLVERPQAYALLTNSPHLASLASLKVHSTGVTVLRKIRQHLKPTTAALQRFGHLATRHTVVLSWARVMSLLLQGELPVDLALEPGYVILCVEGHPLGCGLYTPGRLRSQIPRRLRAHILWEGCKQRSG